MSDIAIRIDNLGKQYRLGQLEPYKTLRDTIAGAGRRLVHRMTRPQTDARRDTFWALKDVSCEVKKGEVVGIIGRNGAGKSTLLKILSRITEPTTGEVELRGRVGSLLEVGTGFHPELTGRENIYLNGAILGMSRGEITRRFDEIVAFAGTEQFLDTPVKRYSSGMYVRLAFAVAAHLEPEILIVDEVLAVGDAEFQKKCLGRMSQVANSGRTVLFVSHNMAAVESLCARAILLQQGQLVMEGLTQNVISQYSEAHTDLCYDIDLSAHPHRVLHVQPVLRRLRLTSETGALLKSVPLGDPLCFEIHLASPRTHNGLSVGIHIYNSIGSRVLTFHSRYQMSGMISLSGPTIIRCVADSCTLMPGRYSMVLSVASGNDQIDRIEPCGALEVVERDVFGTGRLPPPRDGVFICPAKWSAEALSKA